MHLDIPNNLRTDFQIPVMPEVRNCHLADWSQEKIIEQIKKFEEGLDYNSEVGIRLASFGSSILMSVEQIGFQNPDLMYFYGFVENQPAQLIQHKNQINFLLTSVPKQDPQAPPKRIGFDTTEED